MSFYIYVSTHVASRRVVSKKLSPSEIMFCRRHPSAIILLNIRRVL